MGAKPAPSKSAPTPEELAFEEEFAKLMKETMEQSSRSGGSSSVAVAGQGARNMAVPASALKGKPALSSDADSSGGVTLTLLKRGHKGKVEPKSLVVPEDSPLAQSHARSETAAKQEQDSVKRLVLKATRTLADA